MTGRHWRAQKPPGIDGGRREVGGGRAHEVTWANSWVRPAGPDHQGQPIDGFGARDALASSGPSEWVPADVTAGANSWQLALRVKRIGDSGSWRKAFRLYFVLLTLGTARGETWLGPDLTMSCEPPHLCIRFFALDPYQINRTTREEEKWTASQHQQHRAPHTRAAAPWDRFCGFPPVPGAHPFAASDGDGFTACLQ